MKKDILSWLESDKSFDAGVKLYQKYGNNISFKTVLNRQGYSKHNEGVLHEELRKLTHLSHAEFDALLKTRVKKIVLASAPVLEPEEDIDLSNCTTEELVKKVPVLIQKSIRLRDDFPFLKSPDCPQEFKILVADMLTAYDSYREAHNALFAPENEDKLTELSAAVVENYIENRSIWQELEYYKENGEVFGKHPIFANKDKFEKLRQMTNAQLIKRMENLRTGIVKDKKKIADSPEDNKQAQWHEALANKESEMAEIKRILNINE